MSLKKIIFINRFFYPNISATSKMLSPLVFYLSNKEEYKTIVICSSNKSLDKSNDISDALIKKLKMYQIFQIKVYQKFLVVRVINYLLFLLITFLILLIITKRKDLVIVKTDPPFLSLIAMLAAKVVGFKYIVWIQDVFPEVAYNLNYLSNEYLFNTFKNIRNLSLKKAKVIVVIGNLMANFFEKQNIQSDFIHIIPNFADENNIVPISSYKNFLIKDYSLEGKFVVGYSGNLGRAHDVAFIIDISKNLQKYPHIVILITGGGYYFSRLKKNAQGHKLKNIIFKDYVSDKLLAMSLSLSHVHLISLKPALEGLVVPSKFYGICAVGKPSIIIGDNEGELATEVLNNECGYVHDKTHITEICASIIELKQNITKYEAFGTNARNLFLKNYTKKKFIERWVKLID